MTTSDNPWKCKTCGLEMPDDGGPCVHCGGETGIREV